MSNCSSLLLGLTDIEVDLICIGADGERDVRVRTAPEWVGRCPRCSVVSTRSKGWVVTRPKDVKVGHSEPVVVQAEMGVPQHRVRAEAVHRVGAADPTAGPVHRPSSAGDGRRGPGPVAVGRRGRRRLRHHMEHLPPRRRRDGRPGTGPGCRARAGAGHRRDPPRQGEVGGRPGHRQAAVGGPIRHRPSRHHRRQGLLAQVNGRDAATVVNWLEQQSTQWRAGITHVAIDLSTTYAKAVRQALPHAIVVVDRFHVVKLANEMIDDVRRRTTQTLRGRRGRKCDPEWVSRRRMLRGVERLTDEQRLKMFDRLETFDRDGDLVAAWITKELLRKMLHCKDTGALRYEMRAAFDEFYTFAAACKVPEIRTLATTVDMWQRPIIAAIETGLSNARSEGLNRIVKHIGRIAFGFRNPTNQRRRIRWACTRHTRPVPSRIRPLRPC